MFNKPVNPFYVLVLIAGIAFAITACAYGIMIVRKLEPPPSRAAQAGAAQAGGVQSGEQTEEDAAHELVEWMDRHGFKALMIELAVLAVATLAAMGTDELWTRRGKRKQPAE